MQRSAVTADKRRSQRALPRCLAACALLLLAAACTSPEPKPQQDVRLRDAPEAPVLGLSRQAESTPLSATLVAAPPSKIAALRDTAPAPAWIFRFSGGGQSTAAAGALTITLSSADFAEVRQDDEPDSLLLIDFRLGRVFHLDPAAKVFWSTSISTEPYFRLYEWQHRRGVAQMLDSLGSKTDVPSLTSDFWRSHELGIRDPGRPAPAVTLDDSGGGLALIQDGEEVISLTPAEATLPPAVVARLWDVLLRVHPTHPAFVQRAVEKGLVPARLSFARRATVAKELVELRLRGIEEAQAAYPLTADFTPESPSVQYNPRAAWLVAVAWDAAKGEFPAGTPDTAYWRARFDTALKRGSDLELVLTYMALKLYAGSVAPGCDGAAGLDAALLCPYVKQVSERARAQPALGHQMALIGAADAAAKREAVVVLPSYRAEAGDMAPLIDLFIANHINDLTKTVTRGDGGPDRDEAVDYYLSALKSFPFIRQIYGDIADYYFAYFDMRMGFFFADVGRALPVAGQVLPGSNLASVAGIEEKLKADFPAYY